MYVYTYISTNGATNRFTIHVNGIAGRGKKPY